MQTSQVPYLNNASSEGVGGGRKIDFLRKFSVLYQDYREKGGQMRGIENEENLFMNGTLDLYQVQHPKFKVHFLPHDSDQRNLAELYATRLSLKNPFTCGRSTTFLHRLSFQKRNQRFLSLELNKYLNYRFELWIRFGFMST